MTSNIVCFSIGYLYILQVIQAVNKKYDIACFCFCIMMEDLKGTDLDKYSVVVTLTKL